MEQRNVWVDYAKAIGIILVVYGHVARGVFNANIPIPKAFYDNADSIIYSFHMPLFFFLSGIFFISSFSKRGGFKLVLSKVDTVFYPYVIWSILQGSIEVFLANYTNGSLNFSDVLAFLWAPRAQFWFLYALFFIFVFSAILFFCLQKIVSKASPLVPAIIVFIFSILIYLYPAVMPDNVVFRFLADNLVYFIFGVLFSFYSKSNRLASAPQCLLLAVMFVVAQAGFHFGLGMNYADKGILSLVLGLLSILFIVSLSQWAAKKPSRWMIYIGTSSMGIYLMHILAGSGIRVILKSFLGVDAYIVHLIVGCMVGLIAPLIALIIIEKLKIPFLFSAPVSKVLFFIDKK